MAGLRSGKSAALVVEQIDPDRRAEHDQARRTATAPVTIEQTAPAVLKRRQTIDSSSGGKLALQATANARPTMNATFCPLNRIPSSTATTPNATVAIRATRICSCFGGLPAADHVREDVVRQRARAGQRQAGDDGEDGGEGDRRDEAEERRAAEQLRDQRRRHVAAGVDLADHARGRPAPTRRSRRSE